MAEALPPRIAGLSALAANLWWTWHPEARSLFASLSPALWRDSGENPLALLRRIPPADLAASAADPSFCRRYDGVWRRFRRDLDGRDGWFAEAHGEPAAPVAYFSAEYGLDRSLPIYAGGLGFLAGDHLKECSDLRVPLVGVGLLYSDGYLCQRLRADGGQRSDPDPVDCGDAPVTPVIGPDGQPLTVEVELGESVCLARAWRADVGRVPLYLLDTDFPENHPAFRSITRRLYPGHASLRLGQEVVLGVGGRRLLGALGLGGGPVHLNEGHAAFALLEYLREAMEDGADYDGAAALVRATSLFTTHTPVPAGFDVYHGAVIAAALRPLREELGLSRKRFLDLGRHPDGPRTRFNMAVLALRLSGAANGVSARHGEVSRELFAPLWPARAASRVPVGSVTNGVHLPTWLDPGLAALYDRRFASTCPEWRDVHDQSAVWDLVDAVPDHALWERHLALKAALCDRLGAGGAGLDPAALTIGFARRFSTYKRADLVFADPDRLRRILTDRGRPVQLVFAGKAHPADPAGQELLQRVVRFARDPAFEGRVAFMEDYGAGSAPYLVRGVDVWLNNPVPPMEASGTSGMKAAMNGVVNCSVRDGWWLEGHDGGNGWAFGSDGGGAEADADALYDLLETEIAPRYYARGPDGIPHAWIALMKASIRTCAPRFSARRMVKEYVDRYYSPMCAAAVRVPAPVPAIVPAIAADEELRAAGDEV